MKKIIVLLTAAVFLMVSCNQNSDKKQNLRQTVEKTAKKTGTADTKNITAQKFPGLSPDEYYHAVVFDTMTLSQVAKANNIGLPFLKTKLGIPNSVKYDYTIKQLKKNFKFTTEYLKEIIEDSKNRSAVIAKNKKKSKNK